MKGQPGFTLVELMVVISIAALLLTWGMPAFSTWKQKHDVESEMVQLYSDLQYARMNAFSNKVATGIWWDAQGAYHIAPGTISAQGAVNLNGTQIGATVTPKYAVQGQATVSFDPRGFLDPNNAATFLISPSHGAATDCVSVSLTMISLGKNNGGTCNPQ